MEMLISHTFVFKSQLIQSKQVLLYCSAINYLILTSNFLKCYVTFITGISKGFGFLEFKSVSDAQEWMELHKVCQTKYLYTSVFANVHNCILVFISAENTVTNTR